MRTVYPHYYHDFACTADKCPDTCCAGWQIMIDDESMERYEQYVGHFSDRLQSGIDWNAGCFMQDANKRCSMLNEQNLCDMILKMGEHHLCKTCTRYPRHEEEFEGLREWSLSLSCPVAAHIVLSCEEPLRFIEEENDDDDPLIDEFEDFDFLLFTELEDAREVIYKIVQDQKITFEKRLQILMILGRALQNCVEENRICDMQEIVRNYAKDPEAEMEENATGEGLFAQDPDLLDKTDRYEFLQELFSVFSKLERMRDDWQEVVDEEKNLLAKGSAHYSDLRSRFEAAMEREPWWPVFLRNYLMSFVYTYFCGAVYDDWIDTKVMLGVFSVLFTEEFIMNLWQRNGSVTPEECERIVYRYVREVEHSDLNLNTLEEFLHTLLYSPV